MIKHSTHGLLFFDGRDLPIVAYGVSRTHAEVHADALGLIAIHFFITSDGFPSCKMSARVEVAFERWLDISRRIA